MRFCLGSSRRACFLITTIAALANANLISCAASAAAEYSSAITELGQLPQLRPDYPRPTDIRTFSFIFNTPQVLIRSFIPQTSMRMANSILSNPSTYIGDALPIAESGCPFRSWNAYSPTA